jgi:hypothetical protein
MAVLAVVVVVVQWGAAPTSAGQGGDARSTWRYLLSEQRVDEVMAANWSASAKTVEAMTRQAAMECAGVLAGAPQGAELKEFEQELAFAPVAVVMTRRDKRSTRATRRAIRLLHWRDRRLDREVARQLAADETPKPVPHVCRDAEAWRGSGYTRLARATTTFVAAMRRTVVVEAGRAEAIAELLEPYEGSRARHLAERVERLQDRLGGRELRLRDGSYLRLVRSMGMVAASAPPNPASGELYELHVPPPPAVRRAGGGALREFKEGRVAVAASGCLACHRIGEQGNRGPGPPLTRIGSELTEREIRRALVDPRAPMPSFRGMPPDKLHVMIRFLSLLR